MSPPIRDGSGSSIGSIRLGDGSEISEVRTGAGDVLFNAIPGSVVSRPNDGDSTSTVTRRGLIFESTDPFPDIGFRISANTSSPTRAYLTEFSSGNSVAEADISSLSGGDSFTMSDVDLSANTEYAIQVDAEGSTYIMGFRSISPPISSSDGVLTITDGISENNQRIDFGYNIVDIGNIGL